MITVGLANSNKAVRLRPGTTDILAYQEVFIEQVHAIELPSPPRMIIDAGANVGLAAVDFALRHPFAKVIAIEPESENFKLLEINVSQFENIVPVEAALWSGEGRLAISDPGHGEWGFRTWSPRPAGEEPRLVAATTVDKIISDHDIDVVDVLKMDIEGAEKEVLESSARWIGRVNVLIIELHDRFRPACRHSFEQALRGFDCREVRGDKFVCRRIEARWAVPSSAPRSRAG